MAEAPDLRKYGADKKLKGKFVYRFVKCLLDKNNESIEVLRPGGGIPETSQVRIVKKGDMSICALIYQYNGIKGKAFTRPIPTDLIKKMNRLPVDVCGVVFLVGSGAEMWDRGFWVRNDYLKDIAGVKDDKHYNPLRVDNLISNSSYVQDFRNIDDFLNIFICEH